MTRRELEQQVVGLTAVVAQLTVIATTLTHRDDGDDPRVAELLTRTELLLRGQHAQLAEHLLRLPGAEEGPQ